MALLLSLATTSACLPPPEERAARDYVDALQPLLQENSLLADEVLSTAATLFNGARDTEDVEKRWRENVVPIADHLQHQAAILSPPDDWAKRHDELVKLWDSRAGAYRSLLTSLEDGDREGWEQAREQSDKSKLDEEKWFQQVNVDLDPYKLSVDQFP